MITQKELKEERRMIHESNLVERLNARDQKFLSCKDLSSYQYPICDGSRGPVDYRETSSRTL